MTKQRIRGNIPTGERKRGGNTGSLGTATRLRTLSHISTTRRRYPTIRSLPLRCIEYMRGFFVLLFQRWPGGLFKSPKVVAPLCLSSVVERSLDRGWHAMSPEDALLEERVAAQPSDAVLEITKTLDVSSDNGRLRFSVHQTCRDSCHPRNSCIVSVPFLQC